MNEVFEIGLCGTAQTAYRTVMTVQADLFPAALIPDVGTNSGRMDEETARPMNDKQATQPDDKLAAADPIGSDASLLIVDDDVSFLRRIARAMEARGFKVESAESVVEGIAKARAHPPKYAVVDLRLGDGSGLDVIEMIRSKRDDSRVIILTGYGNIATAVTAVKLGAVDYLAKPADADDILAALTQRPGEKAELPDNPMSADRVRWEHIQRVYELCERNVSETARRLNMHRRTLQRILAKRAPK